MDNELKLDDFEAWKKVNGQNFSKLSYIHGIIKTALLSSDLYFAFLDLFWPEFVEHEGMVFIKDWFIKRKNVIVDNKINPCEKEYWVNFLSIDGLLDTELDEMKMSLLSNKIGEAWEAKLKKEYPMKIFKVHIINSEDDVAVTFHQIESKT